MDYISYATSLNPDFKLYLKPETVTDFGLPTDHFDFETDLRIMENMFSGDAANEWVPGITAINVLHFIRITEWADSEDTRFPGARHSIYDIYLEFWQGSGDARQKMTVSGEAEFFAMPETVTYAGQERTGFKLVGHVDRTSGKSADPLAKPNEDTSWGGVKALFLTREASAR